MRDQYQAFLVRLQRTHNHPHWRVRLENAHTGEVLHFATELHLFDYMYKMLSATEEPATKPAADGRTVDGSG